MAAIVCLLLSQTIWIVGAVQQGQEDRKAMFQESFNKAVSFSIFKNETSDPSLRLTPVNPASVAKEDSIKAPHLSMANSYDDLGRMFENAFLLNDIEWNRLDLVYLDSLIQDRAKDLGSTISARLILRNDFQNTTLDSVVYSSGVVRQLLSDSYTVERVIASPQNQYTIRAKYEIIPQNYFLRMRIAIIVSILSSGVILWALLLLSRILKRRHEELQEMQASFHGTIHDLKSPLATAYTSLTTLEESIIDPAKRMAITQSADSVSFLANKITIMLRSSRNIKKVAKDDRKEVFMYDVVEQIRAEMRALFPNKMINVENIADTDFSLFAAPCLFEAVMRILMENAVRYNGNRPKVTVTGIRCEKNVCITVTDNGTGMPKRQLKNIFKPYHTSDKREGTGIGLYYAHTIVKAHGGTLTVESEQGKGSTFTIVMPYKQRNP
jgi:signal transduction histidine kinase